MKNLSYLYNLLLTKFNKIPENLSEYDNYETSDIFEVLCALERSEKLNIDITVWNQYDPEEKHRIGLDIIYQNGTTQYSDIGIDLISRTDDSYIGQCKNYGEKSYIKACELERTLFCGMVIRETLKDFNIFKKIEIISPSSVKISRPKINHNNRYEHIQIDKKYLEGKWLKILKDHENEFKIKKEDNFRLRKCQEDALNYLRENKQQIYKINMACGSGKTLVGLEWLKDVKSWLILVPSTLLLDQIDEILKSNKIIYTKCDYRYKPTNSKKVLCVYNSFDKIKDRKFDKIVVDEAHHILKNGFDGYTYKTSDESEDDESEESDTEETYLDLIRKSLIGKNVLYLSATLLESDFKYSLRQSIEDKNLVDYNIHIPIYKENYEESLINYFKNRIYLYSILAYCNTIKKCIEFTKLCNNNGIKTDYIEGHMSKEKRKNILDKFEKREIRILVSVNILGEGIDLPFANTCCFVDPRYSYYSIIQCIGRVLRICFGKNLAHIILPMILEGLDYKTSNIEMLDFLKIMAKDDPVLLNAIKRKSSRFIFHKIEREIEEKDEKEIENEKTNDVDISEIILDRELNEINDNFDFYCELIKEYIEENNGKIPLLRTSYKGKDIGQFIDTNRQRYRKNKLTQEQIEKLDNIDYKLLHSDYVSPDIVFNKNIELIKEYIKGNKGTLPTMNTKYKNVNIGAFIHRNRQNNKQKKLSKEKIQLFDNIDVKLLNPDKIETFTFDEKIKLLKEYIEENEGNLPANREKYKEANLCGFIEYNRLQYRDKKLSKEKIDLFNSIHINILDPKIKIHTFEENANLIKEYIEENNGLLPIREKIYKGVGIGSFIDICKRKNKRNELSQEKIDLLNSINPLILNSSFERKTKILEKYIKENNDELPDETVVYRGFNLGFFIKKQKNKHKNNKLSQEKIDMLNNIDIRILKPVYEALFEGKIKILEEYIIENKGKLPTTRTKYKNINIGAFIDTNRRKNGKKELSQDRINMFNKIDKRLLNP